ncbi:hypothetical protein Agub_g5751, partial [Astrephomene gubernaculifera]
MSSVLTLTRLQQMRLYARKRQQPAVHVAIRRRSLARRFGWIHASASSPRELTTLFGDDDFYTILGVPPSASSRDIRAAYRSLMRRFHPDRAPEGLRAQLQELCALLNQIAETLSDEDSRALYDRLAGFSYSAVNPFLDSSFAR